ncbi:hypothetical protein [Gilliamella sp. Gris1-4]|uniref:hypothetical protein n=1 Tax=Gilliamella sp. Gris1-4 TaxID=3120244 RepID=UPI00080DA514|nr:hypothetical protein [Gilliamella apicola]OCG38449.1 hypothetical protein A9G31_00090 [Gilliamella apicola]OCG68068.1 hypothetical protein A9G39_03850 [Gilliamella apicola]
MLNHDEPKKFTTDCQTSLVTFCSLLTISLSTGLLLLIFTITALCFGLISNWMINDALPLTLFCFAAFIMGLIGIYYTLRIQFDKQLFNYLSTRNKQLSNTLIELDNALLTLHLIKSNQLTKRTIIERQQGTLRLFRKQITLLIIQIILLIGAWFSGIIQSW